MIYRFLSEIRKRIGKKAPKRVVCLCGISGTGKTWEREHNPALSKLPFADIAEEYKHTCDYDVAFSGFLSHIESLLKSSGDVVAEAIFTSRQKSKIRFWAESKNITVEFLDMPRVDKKILLERVRKDYDSSPKRGFDRDRYEARRKIIDNLG